MLRGDVKTATLKVLGDTGAFEAFTDDNMNAAIAWAACQAAENMNLTGRAYTGTVQAGSNLFFLTVPVLKPVSVGLG